MRARWVWVGVVVDAAADAEVRALLSPALPVKKDEEGGWGRVLI